MSAKFPFGTDNLGRDLLSRLIYGAQTTILIAIARNHALVFARRDPRLHGRRHRRLVDMLCRASTI
jgi:hypothetical protein